MNEFITSLIKMSYLIMESDVGISFLIVILYLLFTILEYFFPIEHKQSIKGKMENVVYGMLKYLFGTISFALVLLSFSWQPKSFLYTSLEYIALYTIAFLLLQDFFYYWYHRAQHSFHWLWPIHELHHSDKELNVTSGFRIYWLETPIQYLIIICPVLFIIGVNSNGLIAVAVINVVLLLFTHSNLKINLGFLTKIISGPQYHRIHHSILPEHEGKNLVQFFPVYDMLFGTYYHPNQSEYSATGLPAPYREHGIIKAMLKPFLFWFK